MRYADSDAGLGSTNPGDFLRVRAKFRQAGLREAGALTRFCAGRARWIGSRAICPFRDGDAYACGRSVPLRELLIARQIRSDVAGISMWRMPSPESASTIALATAGMAPTQPASPQPLTPSGLVGVGTGLLLTWTLLKSPARGMA